MTRSEHILVLVAVVVVVLAVGLLVDYHAGFVLAVGLLLRDALRWVSGWMERQA